ncbi:MAG: NAD+ synthase [Euryarchaeota archaeon]|nr:NAD+ synthase [Euryarchaeota archaeon]
MSLRVALAQVNPTVGDIHGNRDRIIEYIARGKDAGAELVVFPELAVTGYPPKDLVLKSSFVRANLRAVEEIAEEAGVAAVVGFVDRSDGHLYNAAALISGGEVTGVQHKTHLPNYDVFDEQRYFTRARSCHVFTLKGVRLGISICEDIWVDRGPPHEQAARGAELLINISASPFHAGKFTVREELLARRAAETGVPVLYCNLVGGQDDLVFDGGSYVFNGRGEFVAQAGRFREDLLLPDLETPRPRPERDVTGDIHDALVLGLSDYMRKNGFEKAVVGLSGGIDSSLVAVLAARALAPERVLGVCMPSPYTSKESVEDARHLAENLGIAFTVIPIGGIMDAYMAALEEQFRGQKPDVTEENIQARIRGNILMALSNKFGYLVLSTGNKSETAVGYTTLYGDMSGGLAVISDVPKTTVYKLAGWINSKEEIIPRRVLEKEPTAELRPGQRDTDSLPPYEVLDPVLHAYIEENRSAEEIIKEGFDPGLVLDIIRMVDRNEYKRQQAPPGIRITPKAFGPGRRMPITNRWQEEL